MREGHKRRKKGDWMSIEGMDGDIVRSDTRIPNGGGIIVLKKKRKPANLVDINR